MFYCSTMCSSVTQLDISLLQHLCSTLSQWLLNASTIRWYTVAPSEVPLFHFHHPCSTVLPSAVLLFHHLSSTVPLFHNQMFFCSTMRCLLVFHHDCSTIPHSVPLFHDHIFHCSTIRCSIVPPSLLHCATIRCSTVLLSDVPMF